VLSTDSLQVLDLRNDADLKDYDLVFFRGKLAASINIVSLASHYLEKHDIPHVNTAYSKRRPVGKVQQMYQLHELGLSLPKTVGGPVDKLQGLIEAHIGYPAVVKDVQGAHGNANFLVHSDEELQAILRENADISFMAQEFIKSDGDFRVLLVGEQVAIIHRKGADDTHLNNTSQGGKATLVEPEKFSDEIIAQSLRFAEYCGYEIAGVDVIIDEASGQPYFLEINSQPQMASGAFTDLKTELLGSYFAKLLGV
jgi:gamma-F420-2:alpha-L-glutamate ligase